MVKFLNTKGGSPFVPLDQSNAADFDAALEGAGGKLVVVDFTASWCGPCQMIGPKFAAMSEYPEYADVCFFKVDVDENDETAESQGIQAMPTFIFYRNGQKIDSLTGASEAKLKEKLDKLK